MTAAILTDIEGTTSSIAFVKETLFPYARARLAAFVTERGDDPIVREQLDAARALAEQPDASDAEVAQILEGWIDEDRKATPLKTLQGLIWESGYHDGDYQAHLYDDALTHLRAWHAAGTPLYVYSSGSVKAQRLFFGYSVAGDLTPLFNGFFDTTTGPKFESESYAAICAAIGQEPSQVLFLSDVQAELDAAQAAGLMTCWLVRDGELPAAPTHPVARTFDEIPLD